MKAWLIICQDLYRLSFPEQNVADCRILHRVVFLKVRIQRPLSSCCRSGHQLVDIRAADRDRKKAYCRQYRETSAYIIRHYECLVAFLCSEVLKRSFCLICSGIYPLCRLFLAVFLFQHFFKDTEGDSRLCGRSGFGNDVHGEISVSDHIDQMLQISAADAVSYIIDLRSLADLF